MNISMSALFLANIWAAAECKSDSIKRVAMWLFLALWLVSIIVETVNG